MKNKITRKSGNSHRLPKPSRRLNAIRREIAEYCVHQKIDTLIELVNDQKGFSNQDRFEAAFNARFAKPWWFKGIRRATRNQNLYQGTDFFIVTEFGEARFDVKSSWSGYEKQIQRGGFFFVWCAVVTPDMTDQDIRQVVFDKCGRHIWPSLIRRPRYRVGVRRVA